jgi:hypothetical protein
MADWARVLATTLRDYRPGAEETLVRNIHFMSMLKERGRIVTNVSGDEYDWAAEFQRADVNQNAGDTALTYDPVQRYIRAHLDVRGYAATDSMSKREYLKNRGKAALIKYFEQMGKKLFQDVERKVATALYADGNATGYTEGFHGLQSFLGYDGTKTVIVTTGEARSKNNADYFYWADDSFAGIDTDLGAYGGSAAGWPLEGDWNDTADFWTPAIVWALSPAFAGTAQTWAAQCLDVCTFMATALNKDSSKGGKADMGLLTNKMYAELKVKLRSKENIYVETNNTLKKLGFGDTVSIDGIEYMGDFGVPVNNGFVLNTNHLTVRSYQPNLIETEGPDYHKQTRAYRTAADVLGNMHPDSPKYFGRIVAA